MTFLCDNAYQLLKSTTTSLIFRPIFSSSSFHAKKDEGIIYAFWAFLHFFVNSIDWKE